MRWRSALLPRDAPGAAFRQLVIAETRLALRLPISPVLGFGLPALLLIIIGSVPGFRAPRPDLGGLSIFELYMPILLALTIAGVACWSLPGPLAAYREQGILRRLFTTPIPPAWVLGAQLVVQVVNVGAALLILIGMSMAFFGVAAPASPVGLLLSLALVVCGLFAIGLVVASRAPGAQSASGIAAVLFFPLMFFAGLWVPQAMMPAGLREIGGYTPLGAAVQAIQQALYTGFPAASPLLVLAAYSLVFGFIAVRFFRWE
jgi:ABC-2 type transport system permease protein